MVLEDARDGTLGEPVIDRQRPIMNLSGTGSRTPHQADDQAHQPPKPGSHRIARSHETTFPPSRSELKHPNHDERAFDTGPPTPRRNGGSRHTPRSGRGCIAGSGSWHRTRRSPKRSEAMATFWLQHPDGSKLPGTPSDSVTTKRAQRGKSPGLFGIPWNDVAYAGSTPVRVWSLWRTRSPMLYPTELRARPVRPQ